MGGNGTWIRGVALVGAATVLWSTAGIFVRLVDLDAWTILGWRSLFAFLALVLIIVLTRGRQVHRPGIGGLGLLCIPVATVSMGAYVLSLTMTSVANVMVVYATVPLLAAAAAWLILGERASATAIVASFAALAGVAIMVGGATRFTDVAGSAVALAMTMAMALQIVIARARPNLDMASINAAASLVCTVIGLILSQSDILSLRDMIVLAGFGITNTALAYYFVLRGARDVPSAEVGLISSLDVVLGPLWVWLLFFETPARTSLIGGGVVLAAVTVYLVIAVRKEKAHEAKTLP